MKFEAIEIPEFKWNPSVTEDEMNKAHEAQENAQVLLSRKLRALEGYYQQTLEEAFKEHHHKPYFILKFSEPVVLTRSRRGGKAKTTHRKMLFTGANHGRLCYYTSKRSGFAIEGEVLARLVSMEPEKHEDFKKGERKKLESIFNRFHPDAWTTFKENALENLDDFAHHHDCVTTSIKNKFPHFVIQAIREAFEEKREYRYRQEANGPQGRSLSVQVSVNDNGEIRAWFSSEYAGCANGDYWILINPTTAAFRETD